LQNGLPAGVFENKEVTREGVPLCCLPAALPLVGDGFGPSPAVAWNAGGAGAYSGEAVWKTRRGRIGFGYLKIGGSAKWQVTTATPWPVSGQALQYGGSAVWLPL
jgi:hypothetical protein